MLVRLKLKLRNAYRKLPTGTFGVFIASFLLTIQVIRGTTLSYLELSICYAIAILASAAIGEYQTLGKVISPKQLKRNRVYWVVGHFKRGHLEPESLFQYYVTVCENGTDRFLTVKFLKMPPDLFYLDSKYEVHQAQNLEEVYAS